MKRISLVLALLAPAAYAIGTTWLSIAGDATQPSSETVEVDVNSIAKFNDEHLIAIRVNRASERMGRDGRSFRSYTSTVAVDCTRATARHIKQTFYVQPLWTGEARTYTYADGDVRPMAFASFNANPNSRIIASVCNSATVLQAK